VTTKHESKRDEIAAYLLGALDPEEAASLERHLATGCVECRAELRWLEPAVHMLPDSVEQLPPPRALRKRVLDEARQEAGPAATHRRARMRFLAGRGFSGRSLAAAAALALVAVAAGVYAGGVGDSGGGQTSTVAAGSPPGVVAKVVREDDRGTLRLANVDPMSEGRVLEAWVRRDGEVLPVRGLFAPDDEGRATTTIPDMRGVEVVMVTAEPPGGSPAPTSAPMVTLEMPG
jgi:anti-sigma-K factor RskA